MFIVIDNTTGKYPDAGNIALKEEWAKGLIHCDIDGFYFGEEGELVLIDDCGNCVWCDRERFIVKPDDEFIAKIEDALRESIVVWEEEEYRDIARKIAEKLVQNV